MKNFFTAKILIVPNDKVTKKLFNFVADEYSDILEENFKAFNAGYQSKEKSYKILEGKVKPTKKKVDDKIESSIYLLPPVALSPSTLPPPSKVELTPEDMFRLKDSLEDDDNSNDNSDASLPFEGILTPADFYTPLNQFDKLILCACISEYSIGNIEITPSIIYRDVFGKEAGKPHQTPTVKQVELIVKSLYKMAYTKIKINLQAVCRNYGYSEPPSHLFNDWTPILPCNITDGKLRGQSVKIIKLTAESPILTACNVRVKDKGKHKGSAQILRIPCNVLNTGKCNSQDILTAKFYAICRAVEIIQHKLTPTITSSDIIAKCNVQIKRSIYSKHLIDGISLTMENLKAEKIISNYELIQPNGNFTLKIS